MISGSKKSFIAIGIGVISISTAAIFVKLSTAPSSVIATYRLLFAVIILSVPTFIYYSNELKKLTKTGELKCILTSSTTANVSTSTVSKPHPHLHANSFRLKYFDTI